MIEFIHSEAFKFTSIENIVGNSVFQDILQGTTILLLVHITEAYHYVIDDIYQEISINQKIPIENILYLTNSADINHEIDAISEKYNLPKMPSMHMSSFEFGAQCDFNRHMHLPNFSAITLIDKEYTKKFLSLNGLWRPHRMLLGSFLTGFKIIDQGYVSLNCVTSEVPSSDVVFTAMLDWCKNNYPAQNILLENEDDIKKISKLFLDEVDNSRPAYSSLNKKYYEDTYFSIVTETLAWKEHSCGGITTGRALSEKTFKPILFKHPFMLISLPRSLQLLRDLGYKTFSECIDESYDTEQDDSKRVYMVAKEAERLCNLSTSELKDFLKIGREITNYNFEVLKNKQNFVYKKT